MADVFFQLPFSGVSLVFLFAAGLLFVVALGTRRFGTGTPVQRWFLVLLLADGVWALSSVGPIEAGTTSVAFAAEAFRVGASSVAAVSWFSFAAVYTGRTSVVTRRRLALLVAPFVVHTVAFMTNHVHGLSARALEISVAPVQTVVVYEFGPVYTLATLYALALVVGGSILVIQAAIRDPSLYADQSLALFIGSLMPIIGVGLTFSGVTEIGSTNLTPATLTVTALAYGYALFRADLLATGPLIAAEGREVAIESLEEGFLIADGTGRVVESNAAARAMLDVDDVSGESLEAVFPADEQGEVSQKIFRTDEGRFVEAQVTSLSEDNGDGIGRVVTLRDVSDQRQRQERLRVLNRVLRHNVRNDLDIVLGYANQLTKDGASRTDTEVIARRIADSAENLLSVAEKARTVEELLDTNRTRSEIALSDWLEERADRATATADGPVTVHTDLPEDCRVRTVEPVLGMVIDELLGNAIRHSDRAEPTIRVSASAGDSVVICIADDGPGIPDQDREAIERGAETPLEHGSRLGLWTVRWGVHNLNGSFSVRDRSPRGTVVEIRFPRHDPDQFEE